MQLPDSTTSPPHFSLIATHSLPNKLSLSPRVVHELIALHRKLLHTHPHQRLHQNRTYPATIEKDALSPKDFFRSRSLASSVFVARSKWTGVFGWTSTCECELWMLSCGDGWFMAIKSDRCLVRFNLFKRVVGQDPQEMFQVYSTSFIIVRCC